jgi:hypothetical protein
MGGHKLLLMVMVWVWVQILRKISGLVLLTIEITRRYICIILNISYFPNKVSN